MLVYQRVKENEKDWKILEIMGNTWLIRGIIPKWP